MFLRNMSEVRLCQHLDVLRYLQGHSWVMIHFTATLLMVVLHSCNPHSVELLDNISQWFLSNVGKKSLKCLVFMASKRKNR